MYDKGAWVLHMLRWEVGDSSFFNILRTYFDTFKYSNASTNDFKNICEQVSGKNLTKFFDQWVQNEGQIEIEYETEIVKSEYGNLVKINLEQIQEDYEVYNFPLEIKIIYADSSENSFRYEIVSKDTVLEIPTIAEPDTIELDPNNWLLAQINMKEE